MNNPKDVIIKKECHSRTSLSGIYNARRYQTMGNTLLNRCVEDPRLQLSGMTANFKEEALNKGAFRAPLRSGFTLIELLVVVLIIGILAAVAVPQYQKAVDKARVAETLPILKAVASAEKLYYLSNDEYTNNFDELDINLGTQDEETNTRLKYIQSTTNWHIKLMEIPGGSIYAKSRFNDGLFIYYYLKTDSFHCCFSTGNTRAQKLCSSFGSNTSSACATDENLSCYPMKL